MFMYQLRARTVIDDKLSKHKVSVRGHSIILSPTRYTTVIVIAVHARNS